MKAVFENILPRKSKAAFLLNVSHEVVYERWNDTMLRRAISALTVWAFLQEWDFSV